MERPRGRMADAPHNAENTRARDAGRRCSHPLAETGKVALGLALDADRVLLAVDVDVVAAVARGRQVLVHLDVEPAALRQVEGVAQLDLGARGDAVLDQARALVAAVDDDAAVVGRVGVAAVVVPAHEGYLA